MQFTCDFDAGKSGEYGGGCGQCLQCECFAQARHLLIDSTTVPAHQHAAGAPKKNGGDQALGRSRGGLSTKIHAATIDENCSVALHLTAGMPTTAVSLNLSMRA